MKQIFIMKLVLSMFFSFVLIIISANAQDGKIYHLTYSPTEPVVLEDFTLSIGVENPSNAPRSYLLNVRIIRDGKIVHDEDLTFSLGADKGIFLAPKFTPSDIGEHQIIVKLYDKFKFEVYDTQIVIFNSISLLGPFDITVEPLTSRVRPSIFLPVQVTLENMGVKGFDVEVRMTVTCPDNVLSQSLTTFVPANNRTELLISMQTCDEEGLYNIVGSLIVFNKTWISSSSQFFVNSSFIQLEFDPPESIALEPGQSFTFPVEVTNIGNQKITDLKFIVQRIPLQWQTTHPSSVVEVEPNEKVVFIVNITIPEDAEPKTYEVRMTATAEEVLERKIIALQVTPLSILPPSAITGGYSWIKYVLPLIGAVSLVSILIKFRKIIKLKRTSYEFHPASQDRVDMLKKIKEQVKSKR